MKRHVFAALGVVALVTAGAQAYVAQASRPAQQPASPIEDEYIRYELLDPSTHSVRITHDLSVVAAGVTSYADVVPGDSQPSDISTIDLMSGTPLVFAVRGGHVDVTLARPVPTGGQARLRILITLKGGNSYRQSGSDLAFEHPSSARRGAVVLPRGFELIGSAMPVQVIQEADGRIAASFMTSYPFSNNAGTMVSIHARALKSPSGPVQHDVRTFAEPRPQTASADPPRPEQSMDQIRVTERAVQDREIVYFLKQPETHAFSLYHDYTASREGEHQYVNVVRTGSTVSDPSAMILDTGETLRTRTLTGADIAREKIEINERVDPDTQVVLIPFTPVKKGTSIRLRISETYTDPARYALIDGQLMWHRSFGRNRNDMVLPEGWYLTTSSIPAVISTEKDGRIRLSFWNGRPDNVDVFVKGSKR
jgi:hypothetical protein